MLDERTLFYSNDKILFEIARQLNGKETTFMSKPSGLTIRCIKAHNLEFLKKNFSRFDLYTHPMNIYYSWNNYRNMPMFSFNLNVRKEQYAKWNTSHQDYLVSTDFTLDIDSENSDLDEARKQAAGIAELFNELKLPYSVSFSGKKGFHIECPAQFHKSRYSISDFKQVADRLKKTYSCVDNTIYDMKRIFKCKYTIDVTSGLVCLPLSDEQLNNFSFDLVNQDSVLAMNRLGFRKMLLRNEDRKFDISLI